MYQYMNCKCNRGFHPVPPKNKILYLLFSLFNCLRINSISLITFLTWLSNEKKSEQAPIPHDPPLLDNATHDKWQGICIKFTHKIWKRAKLAKIISEIKTFCKYMHIYFLSFTTTKSINSEIPWTIMESEFPGHLHIVS